MQILSPDQAGDEKIFLPGGRGGGEWFWNPAARVAPGFFPAVLKRVEIGLDYLTLAGVEVRLYMAGRPASHSGHNPVADEIAGTVEPCHEERA